MSYKITIAKGDGIGPEIMDATLAIIRAAGADIEYEEVEIGEKLYLSGHTSGISEAAWDIVRRNKVFLKAPITTPQGGGCKSLNVTFRKALGLFANVRPSQSLYPFVDTKHPKMDLVIIRENEEDLYAGIEYKFNSQYAVAYKVITRMGCEKVIRYAFEYARQNGRKKITALVKDNIMKISDGLFHEVFKEIAAEYPEIKAEGMIVDIGSARVAVRPESFDVIVTENLYGDIISDIAAEASGSVGLAGSANIGNNFAMFEAVHGSAPDIAGKGVANPSGLLNAAIMMLEYLGQGDTAANIKNAWLKTIEDGIHTKDIFRDGVSKTLVNTKEFTSQIINNLGQKPKQLAKVDTYKASPIRLKEPELRLIDSDLVGVDFYVNAKGGEIAKIATAIAELDEAFNLQLISHRGIKVWPKSGGNEVRGDILRCRFFAYEGKKITQTDIARLMAKIDAVRVEIVNIVMLNIYDKKAGFSMAQGE